MSNMRKILFIILTFFCSLNIYAQKYTIVIIIDKNADYIDFEDHHLTTDKYLNYSAENSGQS